MGVAIEEPFVSAYAITRLILTDFRNYTYLKVEADSRPVVLTGANGSGKTNLLEAISFLTPGRGLRRAKLTEAANIGGRGGWAVAADVASNVGTSTLGTGVISPVGEAENKETAERRSVKIDGQNMSGSTALSDYVKVSWLTPQMDRLFQEGASGRRRFLDRLTFGFDPAHGKRMTAFEKVMRDRNRLLKEGRYDRHWLASLERSLAETGTAIAAARRETAARLNSSMATAAQGTGAGAFPKAEVSVEGLLEGWLEEMSALAVEDKYRSKLEASRRQDAMAGSTSLGPHRSDLGVLHKDKGMPAGQCSTGEQKALLISIILGDARLQAGMQGQAPVLLLDEITAHLDQKRRAALFDEIEEMKTQAWMTGTDYALFSELGNRAQFLTVDNGTICRTAVS
ncbi:DNA replication/repair protein RecF [Sneathiella sp. HT1-7]|uniref:DNA replication/repair protein RecF n=1 Tax=Sneathiella sp. HT1-7 TaxID=2887192 RepID=UPI001D135BD4|nr:DNA replication/repair protein RecF [Sneathiella sp. HT1-7]MCC3303932.1 DNA replication/repair protein RecF [Sneathiella sp. HT1-7]